MPLDRGSLLPRLLPAAVCLLCWPARAQEGRAEGLARASGEVLKRDSTLALLLAREALVAADIEPARTAVYDALVRCRERRIFRGHEGPVVFVDLAPDGQTVATASADGTARLWTPAGEAVAVLQAGAPVDAVRFVGSADRIVTASGKGLILWNRAGDRLAEFPPGRFEVAGAGLLLLPEPGRARVVDLNGKVAKELEIVRAGLGAGSASFYAVEATGQVRLYDDRLREKVLRGAAGTARAAFAPSGGVVATFGSGPTVEVWSIQGKKLADLVHKGPIEAVSLAPAGDRLLTASADGCYSLWSAQGKRLEQMPKKGPADFVSITEDNYWMVGLEGGNLLTVWDDKGGQFASKRFDKRIRAVEPDYEGFGYVLDFEDGTHRFLLVDLTDAGTENLLRGSLRFHRWSHRGKWLLVADDKGRVGLNHWAGAGAAYLDAHEGAVNHACFSADDRFVVTGGADGTARLWEIDPETTPVLYHRWGVDGVAYSVDGKRLLVSAWSKFYFREADGRLLREVEHPNGMAWWEHGGNRVAVTCKEQPSAWLYDLDGKEIARLPHEPVPTGVAVSHKGDRILTFSRQDHAARLWDGRGKPVGVLEHPMGVVTGHFRPDGTSVLTVCLDGRARIWSTGKTVVAEWAVPERVFYCAISKGGDRILTVPEADAIARVWTPRGEQVAALEGHGGRIWCGGFQEETGVVLTCSADKTARLWNQDGSQKKCLVHPDEVLMGAFLPHGNGIITTCKDGSVRHWSSEGNLLAVITGHAREVWRFACTESGARIATGSQDTTVRIWPLLREDLLEIAQKRPCRDFTAAERARYANLLGQ